MMLMVVVVDFKVKNGQLVDLCLALVCGETFWSLVG